MNKKDQKFKVSEHLLSSAVHYSVDSIVITTKEINEPGPEIIYVNPSFTTLTGYLPEEAIGKTPRILQGPKTDRPLMKKLRECLEQEEVFYGRGINYRKDGSEFWMDWHIEPIRNSEGDLTHFLAIQRDVTDQVEAQEVIDQKNVALKELLIQIQEEKKKIQEEVVLNVEEVLLPALKNLNRKGTKLEQETYQSLREQSQGFNVILRYERFREEVKNYLLAKLRLLTSLRTVYRAKRSVICSIFHSKQ